MAWERVTNCSSGSGTTRTRKTRHSQCGAHDAFPVDTTKCHVNYASAILPRISLCIYASLWKRTPSSCHIIFPRYSSYSNQLLPVSVRGSHTCSTPCCIITGPPFTRNNSSSSDCSTPRRPAATARSTQRVDCKRYNTEPGDQCITATKRSDERVGDGFEFLSDEK